MDQNIQYLQEIFPNYDEAIIRDIFQDSGQSVEKAVEKLISLSSTWNQSRSLANTNPWEMATIQKGATDVLNNDQTNLTKASNKNRNASTNNLTKQPLNQGFSHNLESVWNNSKAVNQIKQSRGSERRVQDRHYAARKPKFNKQENNMDKTQIYVNQILEKNKGISKVLYIARGCPGSGKSTLVRLLLEKYNHQGIILSTDNYFIGPDGKYAFDPTKISEAHSWNQNEAVKNANLGISPIFIDNTNTQLWEMKPYVVLAINAGYHVEFIEPCTWWKFNANQLARRCTHNVPLNKIESMLQRFERSASVKLILGENSAGLPNKTARVNDNGQNERLSSQRTLTDDQHRLAPEATKNMMNDEPNERGETSGIEVTGKCNYSIYPSIKISHTTASWLREKFEVEEVNGGEILALCNKNSNDLEVYIDESFGRELYRQWLKTLKMKHENENNAMVNNDEAIARQLQLLENDIENYYCNEVPKNWIADQRTHTSDIGDSSASLSTIITSENFKDIISEQLAFKIENEEQSNLSAPVVRRMQEKLSQWYPGINTLVLNDFLEQSGYNLEDTVTFLEEVCGFGEPNKQDASAGKVITSTRDETESTYKSPSTVSMQPKMDVQMYNRQSSEYAATAREYCNKARECYQSKQYSVAGHYQEQATHYFNLSKNARNIAAEIMLQSRMIALRQYKVLDLHGFTVSEAVKIVEEQLQVIQCDPSLSLHKKDNRYLTIIVGCGIHSVDGKARIKPAVVSYLKRKKYRYNLISNGAIKVELW
ncbi:NEDD4-binding protein 2-like 1 [Trichoplax sp. H2]|nr:NEDD4-binding protein 2-like 1 [Trichoplax sp. H2]|eukprot:RDD41068.1 NEDD4-binding protein 2-like 1 [Trichoplax sp. H2]